LLPGRVDRRWAAGDAQAVQAWGPQERRSCHLISTSSDMVTISQIKVIILNFYKFD
jgi:hypothetical protein